MLTPFGKELRKLRIDRGVSLKDLSTRLGIPASYASAVETGGKNPTSDYVSRVGQALELTEAETQILSTAAAKSRSTTKIELKGTSERHRELAQAFARKFPHLDDDEIKKMFGLLGSKDDNKGGSTK